MPRLREEDREVGLIAYMKLEYDSTLTSQQTGSLAQILAQRCLPVIQRFEPITDFEELLTFVTENPTPIGPTDRNPAWSMDAVAARLIEASAVVAHEPMLDTGWTVLARIILEHAEYLYTYHHSPYHRERLQAGAALALIGGVCHILPQSAEWRFVGFARISEVIADIPNLSAQAHITEPIDGAFELAVALNLGIPCEAIDAYNAALNRNLRWEKRTALAFSEHSFFDRLDLDSPELKAIKSELAVGNLKEAKVAYTAFRRQKATNAKETDKFTFDSAKSYLEDVRLLSAQTEPNRSAPVNANLVMVDHVMRTSKIGIAALLFPEWRDSQQLLKFALRRFQWLFDTHFYPDGFTVDGAAASHYLSFIGIANFYRFAKLAELDLPKAFHDGFEKIIEVLMYLSQPDYNLPPLGDYSLFETGISEPCRVGYQFFRREHFLFMASQGEAGTPPRETSYAFPCAGYYIMREDWGLDAQYLVVDKLNFILHAHQRPLITQPRIHLAKEVPTPTEEDICEEFLRLSPWRNSVMVDGKGQGYSRRRDEGWERDFPPTGATDLDTRWLTTPTFDFVESWYKGGYGDTANLDFHHKRSIFYVKGDYFILHDLVLGEGEGQLEQIFQLAPVREPSNQSPNWRPGRVQVEENGRVRTAEPDLSNIVIAPVNATDLNVRLQCRKEKPAPGWTALNSTIPLTYTANRTLPAVMNAILFPLYPQQEMTPEIEPIEVRTDADVLATGFSVSHSGHRDIVLISDDGLATMSTSDVVFVGEYLFLRLNTEQETELIAMINGQFLRWKEDVLVDLPEPRESYVRSCKERTIN